VLTRRQARRVDEVAIGEWGMSGLVLMENAGRGCVDLLERLGIAGPIAVCCGRGNNAGDGFVIARHLELRGRAVKVCLWSEPDRLSDDATANYEILARTDVPIVSFAKGHDAARLDAELDGADWIVDSLLGTGATGPPRPPLDEVIRQLNERRARKLAIDLPSGLDCDTGDAPGEVFRADHTATFVAAKPGFFTPHARPLVGELHVLDIGAPVKLIRSVAGGK
jgi:NAD(P)H-hydrate epimerase